MTVAGTPVPRPLVDLHRHLDGAVRLGTLLELARSAGVALPADTVEELRPFVQASPDCRSLRDFLETFETFYPVLRQPGAMGRAAFELVEDAASDGVVHIEVRCCPALQATDGHDSQAVLDEVLAGLAAGAAATGSSAGLIVCAYRSQPLEVNERLVDLAIAHADRGVIGLDLAGPEDLSGAPLGPAFGRAREAGLPVTVHAGEAAGPASVIEALDVLGARRIGHGVAVAGDEALAARIAAEGVVLECCLTSNLQTAAVSSLGGHPFDRLRRAGQAVTLNTDDPAVSGITLSGEFALAAETWGLSAQDLSELSCTAAGAAFLEPAARARLQDRVKNKWPRT